MAAVQGVETNESSRFIDYTQATPWETLISDIEKGLKSLTKGGLKVDITYLTMPFTMEKLKANTVRNKKDISKSLSIRDPLWLSKSFNARTYILFYATGPHFVDYSVTAKMAILSAFTTAVKSSFFVNIPVFFTYSVVTDVGQIKDLIGYHISKKVVQDCSTMRICRYESYLYDKLSPKNELYYFDGIRKIFRKKLASSVTPFSNVMSEFAQNPDNYNISAVNSYLYRVSDFKSVLLDNYLLYMQKSQAANNEYNDIKINSRVVFSNDFNKLLVSLCTANHIRSLHLSHILVKLQYREQKQCTVIDNDSYTTFIPSKQPPSSWKVSSYFKIQSNNKSVGHVNAENSSSMTAANINAPSSSSPGQESLPSTACWMVYCIRKLLVLYIASVYNSKDELQTMDKLAAGTCTSGGIYGRYSNSDLLEKSVVDKVIVMLSVETQATLRSLFPASVSPANEIATPTRSSSREKSHSNPSPVTCGSEEWLDFEAREQLDEVMNFLFEAPEHKEARMRANLAATRGAFASTSTTEDYAPYSFSTFGSPSTPPPSANSPRRPNLAEVFNSPLLGALGGATGNVSDDDEAKNDSIGYFMSLLAIFASCMNSSASGQMEVFCLAKLWSSILKETHNSWEAGNTLPTFTQPDDDGAALGGSFDFPSDRNYHTRSSSNNSVLPPPLVTPPRHQYGSYAKYLTSTANQISVLVGDESKLPICSRDLWQDLIDKKRVRDGLNLALPDRVQTIVVQKLQMLQFCIAMKNESVIYRFRNNLSPTRETSSGEPRSIISPRLYRRLPLTEDTIAMQERISQKVSSDTSSSGKDHPLLKWQVMRPELISDINAFKAANAGADLSAFLLWYGVTVMDNITDTIHPPQVPSPTVGIAIMSEEMDDLIVEQASDQDKSETIVNQDDDITDENVTLQPEPQDKMTSIDISLSTLEEIWRTCEGVHCEAQKPLFQAEKEAEKSLAYLEKIPFTQLSCTLLTSAMRFVYRILHAKLNQWILKPMEVHMSADTKSNKPRSGSGSGSFASPKGGHKVSGSFSAENMTASLVSDLVLLKEQINNAVRQLKSLSSRPVTAPRDEDAISSVIILVDSVAGLVEKLENVCLKADELDMLFKGVVLPTNKVTANSNIRIGSDLHRMLVALSLKDNYFAEQDEEVALLIDFIKVGNMKGIGKDVASQSSSSNTSSSGGGAHAWHSYDGRELGLPTSKSFSLRVGGDKTNQSRSQQQQQFVAISASTRADSLDFARSQSEGGDDTQYSSGGAVTDFQMDAVMEQHSLRITFRIPEQVD